MPIKRINEFPEGSGSLTTDDIFLFMDDPIGSGVTKKISLSNISSNIVATIVDSAPETLDTLNEIAAAIADNENFFNIVAYSGDNISKFINDVGYSINGHTHSALNITDFNSSVSGLLPVKDIVAGSNITVFSSSGVYTISGGSSVSVANSGDNRILTSTGTSTGINAETNMTFNGSGLNVTGTAQFYQIFPTVSGLGNVNGTVNSNASLAQVFDMTLTGGITLANPTNPIDGVTLRWRITQDNSGNRSVTLGNKFNIPSSATNPLPFSTASGVMDVLAATYHSGRDKWDIIAFVPGY